MPIMGGLEATEIIRNDLKLTLPIIALTASVLSKEQDACKEVGMSGFLSKPLRSKELYSMMEELVDM